MLSQSRETEIYADVARILEWSDNCVFQCPLSQQYQNYLRLFEEFSHQKDEIAKLTDEIRWLKREIKVIIKESEHLPKKGGRGGNPK